MTSIDELVLLCMSYDFVAVLFLYIVNWLMNWFSLEYFLRIVNNRLFLHLYRFIFQLNKSFHKDQIVLVLFWNTITDLFLESNTTAQEHEDPNTDWKGGGGDRALIREDMARSPASMLQNAGKVKFDPPKVPVIFVLGNVFSHDFLDNFI